MTEAARKALSCVYRTGNRFGVGHLIDVLQGKETDKVREFLHQHISTFGIGKDLDEASWRAVFRQLLARGALRVSPDGHGGLELAEAAKPILRGEVPLYRRARIEKFHYHDKNAEFASAADRQLWQALRACRKQLADEQNVPAYVIFHDSTLREIAARRPQSIAELAGLPGIGHGKLARYGEQVIETVAGAG